MKDITILIPVHEYNDEVKELLSEALASVMKCQENYSKGRLIPMIVYADGDGCDAFLDETKKTFDGRLQIETVKNDGDTDYCSQINLGVENVKTEHFSILEFDDTYTAKWFDIASRYFVGNETISVFLPINLLHNVVNGDWQYGNAMGISPMFITPDENDKDEIGIINFMRLEKCALFNLTGSIFNTSDFKTVGKYKPSIKVAFNYEFLLRLTRMGLKAMVVPKEGYVHAIGRRGSLTDKYVNEISEAEQQKWFALAIRECVYKEDRKKDITNIKEEAIK